jgi:hypothetical protein
MSASTAGTAPQCFIAERFLSHCSAAEFAAVVAAERAAATGMSIELVEALYIPEDETCFSVLRAADIEGVWRLASAHDLDYQRVLPVLLF